MTSSHDAYMYYRRMLEENVLMQQANKEGEEDLDLQKLRVVSTGSQGRTQMELGEARWTTLYGISRSWSIPEIAQKVGRSISTVHEMMEVLRDEGFIEPWTPNRARSKRLTDRGKEWVTGGYSSGVRVSK